MTLDEMEVIVALVVGAYPQMQDKEMAPVAQAWHVVLGHLDEELVRIAACEVLDESDYFPAPSKILAKARELLREQQPNLFALPAPEKNVTPQARMAMKKVLELVASGEAKDYLASMDISKELAFARSLFPNIGEERVRKNYAMFTTAMKEHSLCDLCGSARGCPFGGLRMELRIETGGVVRDFRAPCKNNTRQVAETSDLRPSRDYGRRPA